MFLSVSLSQYVCCIVITWSSAIAAGTEDARNVCHCRESICLSLKCLADVKASVCLRFPIIKVPVCHYRIYCLSISLSVICFTMKHNIATGCQWGCMVLCGHCGEHFVELILSNTLLLNLLSE